MALGWRAAAQLRGASRHRHPAADFMTGGPSAVRNRLPSTLPHDGRERLRRGIASAPGWMTPDAMQVIPSRNCGSVLPLASGALVLGTSAPSSRIRAPPFPLPISFVNVVIIFPHGKIKPKCAAEEIDEAEPIAIAGLPGGMFL